MVQVAGRRNPGDAVPWIITRPTLSLADTTCEISLNLSLSSRCSLLPFVPPQMGLIAPPIPSANFITTLLQSMAKRNKSPLPEIRFSFLPLSTQSAVPTVFFRHRLHWTHADSRESHIDESKMYNVGNMRKKLGRGNVVIRIGMALEVQIVVSIRPIRPEWRAKARRPYVLQNVSRNGSFLRASGLPPVTRGFPLGFTAMRGQVWSAETEAEHTSRVEEVVRQCRSSSV